MNRRVHLDANVVIRFLRNDDARQSPIAASLFQRAKDKEIRLLVSAPILLEVFYVFVKVYRMSAAEIATILRSFLNSGLVLCDQGEVIDAALKRIHSNKTSFADAYLTATALEAREEIATFDEGIKAQKDVKIYPLK